MGSAGWVHLMKDETASDPTQVTYPTLDDHSAPMAFEDIINTVSEVGVQRAQSSLIFEGLYEFLKRVQVLRIQLRHIEQELAPISMPPDLPVGEVSAAKPQKSRRSSQVAWAWSQTNVPAIRKVYDRLVTFVEETATDINSVNESIDGLNQKTLKKWNKASEKTKRTMVREWFEKGQTKDDPRFEDVTHYTSHFRQVRTFIGLAAAISLREHLEKVKTGVMEMSKELELR